MILKAFKIAIIFTSIWLNQNHISSISVNNNVGSNQPSSNMGIYHSNLANKSTPNRLYYYPDNISSIESLFMQSIIINALITQPLKQNTSIDSSMKENKAISYQFLNQTNQFILIQYSH